MSRSNVVALLLAAALLCAVPDSAGAQERRGVGEVELDRIVVEHVTAEEAARKDLRAFVGDPDVRRIAAEHGIDLTRVEQAIEVLSPGEAAQLAVFARDAMPAQAGGDSVVISATALIIVLLIVILLVVA
ncbi:MAG: hypothetical protein R6X22_09600 [Gemmatimonadota bacterium]